MLFLSIIVLLQLKNENSTTCRAIVVFVSSKTKDGHNNIGADLSINVLNDHKPIFSCPVEKGNLSPKKKFAQMNSTKFNKLRIIYTKEKSFR